MLEAARLGEAARGRSAPNPNVGCVIVKDGEIVLNISADAAHRLTIGDDAIQFAARFGGVSRECSVPIPAVLGIFARENSQGLFFQAESSSSESATGASASGQAESPAPAPGAKRKLQLVK